MLDEILGLETKFWEAMKSGDVETAAQLVPDRSLLTGAQGASEISRDDFRAMLRASTWKLERYEIREPRLQSPRDDVAILTYLVHEEMVVDGKPVSLDAADASVWIRNEGGWVCALHTESLLGDPFGRDRVPRASEASEHPRPDAVI